ncbi:diguanylate cyclase domain-containing protein [Paenibacillus mendelii]|uniref:Diguanylate cyclase domain-containing protein n=1 Tax=Paenibacillus mendelii TaxID=206163 RepID=A0ABV6J5R4_9BACL|nr:diguanylate cyclase [Paenibacillus mendelii]MCQ6560165.1 diguanylate cyclase [Paenibacillus mendelii]
MKSSTIGKLRFGFLQGVHSLLLMIFSVRFDENVIIDIRQIPILIAAHFGGIPSAIVTAVVISLYRILFYGGIYSASVTASIGAIIMSVGAGLIFTRVGRYWHKWAFGTAWILLIVAAMFLYLLGASAGPILQSLLPLLAISSIFTAAFIRYYEQASENFSVNAFISELTQKFRQSPDAPDIYVTSLKEMIHLFRCSAGSIVLISHNHCKSVCQYVDGEYMMINRSHHLTDFSAHQRVMNGQIASYPDWLENRPEGSADLQYQRRIRSSIYVPIVYKDKTIAMIHLASRYPRHFKDKDLETILKVVPLISLMMSLKESESMFNAIMHSSNDAIIVANHEGNIELWNTGAERLFGYAEEEAAGLPFSFIIADSDKAKLLEQLEHAKVNETMSGIGQTIELEGLHRNLSMIPIEVAISSWETGGLMHYSGIIRNATARKQTEGRLMQAKEMFRKLSKLDGLTGIRNRRSFDERYSRLWTEAAHQSVPLSVIMLDIDFFKAFNDTYGHQVGDSCLKKVAGVLDQIAADHGYFAARYGGEEFVCLLPKTTTEAARAFGEMLCTAVRDIGIPHKKSLISTVVTVSIGVATITPSPLSTGESLVELADKALYQAKLEGRNQVVTVMAG